MKSMKELFVAIAISTMCDTTKQYLMPNNELAVVQCETSFRRGKQYKTPTKRDPLTKKTHKKLIKERRRRKGKRR